MDDPLHAVVVLACNKQRKILLVQHRETSDYPPWKYGLPEHVLQPGEENLETAAIAALKEMAGLSVTRERLQKLEGSYQAQVNFRSGPNEVAYHPFFCLSYQRFLTPTSVVSPVWVAPEDVRWHPLLPCVYDIVNDHSQKRFSPFVNQW